MNGKLSPGVAGQNLVSDRLILRQLRYSDAAEYTALRYDNAKWLKPWDPTNPLGPAGVWNFRQLVRSHKQALKAHTGYSWVMTLPQANATKPPIIGQISVSSVQWGAALNASIGYWISQSHAGFGFMPEACALVIDHCFSTLQLHRLEINIRPENQPSLTVVKKLGFRDEGVRKAYLHINGQWADHRTFALTKDEMSTTMLEHIYEQRGKMDT